ncbi:MAG TPA: hypothetical protein VFS96_05545 [Nitrolancea sp.]|nr:hypothetical protein [Nitrolancea sp.]
MVADWVQVELGALALIAAFWILFATRWMHWMNPRLANLGYLASGFSTVFGLFLIGYGIMG